MNHFALHCVLDDKYEKLFIFLRANQQTDEILCDYFEDADVPDEVEEESIPSHDPKKLRYHKSMEKEEFDWETLKNRRLTLSSGVYPNPYSRRVDHGNVNRTLPFFIREYRELSKSSPFSLNQNAKTPSVLEKGGWSSDELNAYEDKTIEGIVHHSVYATLHRPQKLDPPVRKFISKNVPEYRDISITPTKAQTTEALEPLFFPPDYRNVSIHTNIFVRFPELSPLFPLRSISTPAGVDELIRVSFLYAAEQLSDDPAGNKV